MDSAKTLHASSSRHACPLRYRSLARPEFHPGIALALGGGDALFCGQEALSPGLAAEVRVDAVKGVAPPLTLYVEISTCDAEISGGYRMSGVIKGIRSD